MAKSSKSKSNKTKVKSKANAKVKSKAKPKMKAAAKPTTKAAKPVVKNTAKSATKQTTKSKAVAVEAKKTIGKFGPKFNPLDDRIVIERVVAPERTAGGLYIPDAAQEKPTVGTVVAVGRGHRDAKGRTRPCDVKIGDKVLFTAWSGSEIELDGVKYVILREPDLLGVATT